MRLKDKVAIVTGGGSGLGQAVAERFAREGASVMLAGRRAARLQKVEADIVAAGGRAASIVTDVRVGDEARRMVAATVAQFGRLDILVNSAGVLPLRVPLGETPDDVWTAVIETNLGGVFHCCKAAIAALCETRGTIVNMASVAGLKGVPSNAAYSISKGGVIQLTRSMAIDYAARGVRVNAVCPAFIETDFNHDYAEARRAAGTYEALVKRHPLGCLGEPSDAVHATLFLASDEAKWITGIALPVDGGVSVA
jgi:meso-butanediol dehydrogenase/(S,S)-butanediol dehydrogenase/diacetyl reductase